MNKMRTIYINPEREIIWEQGKMLAGILGISMNQFVIELIERKISDHKHTLEKARVFKSECASTMAGE